MFIFKGDEAEITDTIDRSVGLLLDAAIAGKTQAQGAVTRLHLLAKAGQQLLVAGDSCINSFGETFTVRNFRYYLSHIQLADSAGNFYQATAADTYLVDLPDSASAFITLTVKGPVHRNPFFTGGR